MSAMLCITALATDALASDVVLRVSALKDNGKTAILNDYTDFGDGWNAAMETASNPKTLNDNGYVRIIVDLYADWNAVNGKFTDNSSNDKGFKWDAIVVPARAKVTLNLGGHTINRGLTEYKYNGEVIYIDKYADVIINGGKNTEDTAAGTITGGFSCNGAGGIHINDGASVALNNVKVEGNAVEDDKGAGIAVYDGATLTMNGGCISNNTVNIYFDFFQWSEGALYVDDSTVTLNNVTISGNSSKRCAGVSASGSSVVTLNSCIVENNGVEDGTYVGALFYTINSQCTLNLNRTVIRNNGTDYTYNERPSSLFCIDGPLNMSECTVTGNAASGIFLNFRSTSGNATINDCTFTDNASKVFRINSLNGYSTYTFTNCEFNNNDEFIGNRHSIVTLTDCDLGNTQFTGATQCITIVNTYDVDTATTGFILSEGSVSMIISLVSLVTSVALIVVTVVSDKKKSATGKAAKAEDSAND